MDYSLEFDNYLYIFGDSVRHLLSSACIEVSKGTFFMTLPWKEQWNETAQQWCPPAQLCLRSRTLSISHVATFVKCRVVRIIINCGGLVPLEGLSVSPRGRDDGFGKLGRASNSALARCHQK